MLVFRVEIVNETKPYMTINHVFINIKTTCRMKCILTAANHIQ